MSDPVAQSAWHGIHTASSARRFVASIVDLGICVPVWGAAVAWTWPSALPTLPWNAFDTAVAWFHADAGVVIWPVAWALAIGMAFNVVFQGRGRDTPGKRLLKLRTINRQGQPPKAAHAMAYALLRGLSSALVFGGHLWALVDRERRTLHDRLCGMWVVHDPPARR